MTADKAENERELEEARARERLRSHEDSVIQEGMRSRAPKTDHRAEVDQCHKEAASWFRDRDELAAIIRGWIVEAFAPSAVRRNRRPPIVPPTIEQCAPVAAAALAIRDIRKGRAAALAIRDTAEEGCWRREIRVNATPANEKLRELGSTIVAMINAVVAATPEFMEAIESAPPIFEAAVNAAVSHGDEDPALFLAERLFTALRAANPEFTQPRAPGEDHPFCEVVASVLKAAGNPMTLATVSSHLRKRRSLSPHGYVQRKPQNRSYRK